MEKLRLSPEFAGEVIKCCCVLHNMLLDNEDEEFEEENEILNVVDPNLEIEGISSDDDDIEEIGNNIGRDRLIRLFV